MPQPFQKPYLDYFYAMYEERTGSKYMAPSWHFIQATKFIKENSIELDNWTERVHNYFDDPFFISHNLWTFINKYPDLVVKRALKDFKQIEQAAKAETEFEKAKRRREASERQAEAIRAIPKNTDASIDLVKDFKDKIKKAK